MDSFFMMSTYPHFSNHHSIDGEIELYDGRYDLDVFKRMKLFLNATSALHSKIWKILLK